MAAGQVPRDSARGAVRAKVGVVAHPIPKNMWDKVFRARKVR